MARLTTSQRKKMPKSEMGLPANKGSEKPSFPMPDKSHASDALRMIPRALKAGSITASQAAEIRAKANKKLGKSGTARKK